MSHRNDALLEAAEECFCFHSRKAARAITQHYDDALRPIGLRATQFTLLIGVAVAGPITVSNLSEHLVMDRTTLARDLRPIHARGWVDISPGKDRRVRFLTLTPKGHRLLDRSIPLWQAVQRQLLSEMGVRRWDTLRRHLKRLVRLTKGP